MVYILFPFAPIQFAHDCQDQPLGPSADKCIFTLFSPFQASNLQIYQWVSEYLEFILEKTLLNTRLDIKKDICLFYANNVYSPPNILYICLKHNKISLEREKVERLQGFIILYADDILFFKSDTEGLCACKLTFLKAYTEIY